MNLNHFARKIEKQEELSDFDLKENGDHEATWMLLNKPIMQQQKHCKLKACS
jgi:hypothetical protein